LGGTASLPNGSHACTGKNINSRITHRTGKYLIIEMTNVTYVTVKNFWKYSIMAPMPLEKIALIRPLMSHMALCLMTPMRSLNKILQFASSDCIFAERHP
jgi:hypothetical protein